MNELLLGVLLVLAAGEASPPGAKTIFESPRQGVLTVVATPGEAAVRRPTSEKAADPVQRGSEPDHEIVRQWAPMPLPLGVRYWIRMLDETGRGAGEVQAGRVFRHGERIQILAETNSDGYLAVLHIGSDGSSGLLFPSAAHQLTDKRVTAYQKVVLPSPRHFFRFDQHPGTEILVLVLSRDRSDLEALLLGTRLERQLVEAVRALGAHARGAKTLVVEELPEATYAAQRGDGMLVQEIALVHQP